MGKSYEMVTDSHPTRSEHTWDADIFGPKHIITNWRLRRPLEVAGLSSALPRLRLHARRVPHRLHSPMGLPLALIYNTRRVECPRCAVIGASDDHSSFGENTLFTLWFDFWIHIRLVRFAANGIAQLHTVKRKNKPHYEVQSLSHIRIFESRQQSFKFSHGCGHQPLQ